MEEKVEYKKKEIKIDDNKLEIELDNNKIIFTLIGISLYQKEYMYNELIKELNTSKDIKNIYEDIVNGKVEIINEDKIRINDKEIKLYEKKMTTEKKVIIEKIKEIEDKSKKDNEKINELIKLNKEKDEKIKEIENKYIELKLFCEKLEKNKKDKNYRDEINIIYETNEEGEYKIFGKTFVKNNKENIELSINEINNELLDKYKLKKGINNIKIKIKNKITNLSYMFYGCKQLKDINELAYLNTKYMGCIKRY